MYSNLVIVTSHGSGGWRRRVRLRLLGGAVAGGRRAARRQRQPRHAVRHARHVLTQRRQETHGYYSTTLFHHTHLTHHTIESVYMSTH